MAVAIIATAPYHRGMTKRGYRLSDEIRAAIDRSGLSQNSIAKELRLHKSAMSRFMADKGGLSMEVLDRLAKLLDFGIAPREKKKAGRSS